MANKPPDNFFKVLQALQYACQKTAPCIKKVVDSWHSQEQPKQQPCRQPQVCKVVKGKPKQSTSCRECINWGKAVEGAHYPQSPQIAWKNVDTSSLHAHAIEVCNGFALNLPSGQRPTKMADYDTASILKIMMGFGPFHQSNQGTSNFPQPYQTIQKVSSIRNNLSHYPMDKQLSMADPTMQQSFQDISDFVQCLVDLQHITQREADDIKTQLDQILKSPSQLTLEMERVITKAMKEGFQEHQDQTKAVADVLEKMISAHGVDIDRLREKVSETQEMQGAHGVDIDRLREKVSKTQEMQRAHGAEISSLKDDVDQLKTDTHQEDIKRREEKVAIWRNELKDKYLKERKKIRFGKGNQEIADIDDIFVDLSISVSPKNSNVRRANIHKCYKPFESYVDLLHLKTAEDRPHHHILLSGVAGSGKTTLLSRIACDWAKEVETTGAQQSSTLASDAGDSSWSKFKLLFLLDIKKIKPDTSLEQAIKSQLLPGVPEEDIERVMSNLKGSCLVLLDGFDEVQAGVDTNDSALCSPLLGTCFVIVTSRPHMVDHFCSISSGYAIIWLSGFSWKNSLFYIKRFFREQEHLGNRFIEKVKATPLLRALSPFPILLVMMCILWEHSQRKETAFKSLTGLYQQAVVYLNKPFRRPTPFIENLDSILEALGKPGLTSLFNNNLQIDKSAFNDETILKKSFHMGLAYEEECPGETVVYFIHKTFQEFCSAKYLVSLAESDHSLFESHLKNIDETNVLALQYLLQFSCGLNFKAAVMIFSHVVNLLSTKPNDEHQNHWALPLMLLYEMETNDSHSSNNQQMHPLLKQLADHNLIVHLRDRDLSYILSHFIVTDKHSPDSWLRYVKYLIINNYGNDNIEASMFSKYLEHMDSVEKLILTYVKLIGAFDFQCYRTIKEVELSSCTIPTSILVRLLSCMPALQQVAFESVNIEGSIDSVVPIQCASIEKFAMSKCSVDANAMLKLISCLPIRNIYLWQNNFRDETDIDGSLSCPAIHRFTMSYGENCIHGSELAVKPNSSTALKFFSCMDSLNELTLQCVDISGKLSKQMNELSQLNISGSYSEYCKVNAHTLMSFISNMDCLQTFSLENASIVGDLLDRDRVATLPASCRVMMRKVQGSACTFVILLNCMKSAKTVSLESLELSGKFDPLISISTGHNSQQVMKLTKIIEYSYITFSHNILQGRKSNVNAQALLNHLQRLPNVQEVDLDRINVSGELQADNTEDCTQFKSLSIKSGTIRAETMMRMMGRMPSLEKLHLGVCLKEEDMLCENPARLKSLKVANISRVQNARTLLTFIACMPSLETLTTWGLFSGEIGEHIPVNCESLEDFFLHGIPTNYEERLCSIPSTVVANILQCMPSLKILRLWFVKLIGRLDFVDDPCSSAIILAKLQHLELFEGEICADTLMTFLCSSPVLRRVVVSRVNVVGELSAKSVKPCPSITEFDMEGSTVDVTTLLAYLECMPSLQKLDLGNVVNLSTSEAPQECNSIEIFKMVGVTIDINVLMVLLSHMPSLLEVVLDRMILNGAFPDALECRSVKGFTMRGGCVNPETLLCLLGSMLPLKKVVLKEVKLQEELQDNVAVHCNALETLSMIDMEVTVTTLGRILHSTPSLTTLQVSRIKGELELGINVSFSKLQKIKILSGELSVSQLAGVLSFMPSVQAIVCQNVNMISGIGMSLSLKCVAVLVLEDCKLEMKIFCWLVSLMSSLEAVVLKKVDLQGEETGRIKPIFKFKRLGEIHISNMSLKTSFISQFLNHTPALQKMQLGAICFEEDANMNISTTFNDLTEFTMEKSKFSALILQRFLKSMPFVSKLNLADVSITGEMDQSLSVTCKSVIDLRMSGTWNSTPLGSNTLSHVLACLPALQSVYLDNLHLQLVTENFKTTIGQSVKKIDIRSGKVEPNAMLKIMSCMPVLETVKFEHVDFTGEVDYTADSQQCSLKCLNLSILKESLRMTLLLGLLNCMPLLEHIRIDSQFDLLGELDVERVRQCKQLKMAVFWCGYSTSKFSMETLVRLLAHCAPSIERVILDNVEHVGEFDGPLSITCASLKELIICPKNSHIAKPWTISINALVKALHCLPSLQMLELGLLDITGELDASVPKLEIGIKSFLMTGGSLSSSVLSALLGCLPVVEKMTVRKLTDQADASDNVCRSLKTLDLSSDITIQANTVVGFVGVMPALEELNLEKVDCEDIVHNNILVNGKTIRSMCLKNCSPTADGVIRLLRHMERLERITLDDVNISNDTDTERIVHCQFVEDFNMKSGSISAGAIIKLLGCMPQISKLTLCTLKDEASDRNVKCNALRELTVSQSNLGVCTMTMLLKCMPALKKLVMDKVNIAGQVHADIAYELRFLCMYEMSESTISAGALLMFVHLMPGLKTVKLCAVQITGELNESNAVPCKSVQRFSLSARSSNQYASATEKQTCSVNATALFGLLGCMVDLVELDLDEVEVVGELSSDTQIRCHKLEKIMMKGGSVSAKGIMMFLEHTHAVSNITLGRTVGEVEVNLNRSTKLMLAKEFVVQQDKNAGIFSGEKLIRFLQIMPALEKASIRVPELGNIEVAEDIRCMNLKELEISVYQSKIAFIPGSQRSTIGANTALKFSYISPCLETLILKQVDVRGGLQTAGNCQPFETLTDLLMIAVSITSETLVQYLHKMPTLERLSLLKMNIVGLLESNSAISFRYLKAFNLSGNKKPLKVSAKMVAMMSSLIFLRIEKFKLVGDLDCSMTTLGTSLTDVHLSDGTIGTVSFFQYLLTLPSLKKLYLSKIPKLLLPGNVSIKSLEEITLRLSKATILVPLLQHMPCVRKVNMPLCHVEIEEMPQLHVKYDAVKEFNFTPGLTPDIDASSIAQLLHHMPSLEKVVLQTFNMSGNLSVCNDLNWKSLKEFHMWLNSSAKANTAMRLLRKMPALEILRLENIRGALNVAEFGLWKSLKKLLLLGATINTGTFLKLLRCMPVLEIIYVRVTLDGNADASYSLNSILEFTMNGSKSSIAALMSVVDCMSALRKLTLEDVQVEGRLDENRSEMGVRLAELSLVRMKLKTSTCIGMLGRMKALRTVSLQEVQLEGVVHSDQYSVCPSVKELQIGNRNGAMDANIPLLLMNCMPSLEKMTLENTYCGKVDLNILPQCKELKEFCLCYASMDTNTFVRYINCMPALQIVNSVRLTGDWDEGIEITIQSITEFSCSIVNRVRFLEAFLPRQLALTKFKLISAPDFENEMSTSDKERVLAVVNSVSSSLKCLELDGIAPVSSINKVPDHLMTMLASCLPNLQELRFPNTNMTEMQCDKFLEMLISTADTAIGQKPSHALPLQWLDLSGSEISKSVGKLAQVLVYMSNLRGLILCSCSLEEKHCQDLSPSVALLNHLVALDLSDNQGVSSIIIASHLRWLKNVKVLKLIGAGIRDEDLTFFPLGQMCGLTELDLSNNPIGDAGLETLLDSVDQEGPFSCDEDVNSESDTTDGLSSDSDSDSDDSFVGAVYHSLSESPQPFLPNYLVEDEVVETLMHSVKQESHFSSDEDTNSDDNDRFSSSSCNIDSDDSFVSAVSHMSCSHFALKKLSFRDCKAICAKGVERLFRDLSKFPKLEELDMTGIYLPTYECMHSPRLCTYLKAAGGLIMDGDNNLFYKERLSLYDADQIKSIKNCSVGE